MKANELVKGKWYTSAGTHKHFDTIYFLFREMKSNEIFAGLNPNNDEFFINVINGIPKAYILHYYSSLYIGEKIDIKGITYDEVISYLPDDNLDKITYLRKQRIKSLLWK